jgi:two-component system sensor histidine kinase BaeS
MIKSLWIKFLILLFSISVISLSATLIFRELIITDFREYLAGKTEDRIYRVMAEMEGSYEKYSGWNTGALRDNAVWALLFGYEVKVFDNGDNELMNTNNALRTLSPLMKKRILAITGFPLEEKQSGKEVFQEYPLFLGGKDIGDLEIRAIKAEGQGKETIFMMRSSRFLIASIFIMGALSVILSFFFSRKLTEPIKKLTIAAGSISEGNIKSRVPVRGHDEMSDLARAFNTMADNIEVHESLRRKLTANIAHELRTPLSAMQGELEGMIDGLIPVDTERLLSLHEETNRLKTIIEGIEALSKAERSVLELRKQSIRLNPFLTNIKGRFEKLFSDKGVALELESDDSVTLDADPDKVSQIVINLLSNALRATASGGRVRMKAGMNDSEGFIEIMDTGSGIKKEDLPFVFERFYKSSDGGLGLGLTIAKELADAHGGRIEVRSEYGKGATFTLFIPNFTNSS